MSIAMAVRQTDNVLHGIRQIVAAQAVPGLLDQELLERFVRRQDQVAFAALMERHGAMVLAVCRRALGHLQDAEDACQAAFLVFARKAASIRKKASLASWLHRVAYRVAADLRRDIARRRGREERTGDIAATDTSTDITWRELRTVLDEELHRLPERYRAPLILCYLEGKTRDEAAAELGWGVGSLKARLERGRERLRVRLVRRGLLLSAVLFGAGIPHSAASAAVPATLAVATVKAASLIAAGTALRGGAVSATVVALTEGALQTMFVTKLKMIATALLVTAALGVGAGGAWSTFGVAAGDSAALDGPGKRAQVQPAGKGAAADPARLAWSELFERDMPFDGIDNPSLLDLDTGKWIAKAPPFDRFGNPQGQAIPDVAPGRGLSDTRTRDALNMVVVRIPRAQFEKATPQETLAALAKQPAKKNQIIGRPENAYYFKTAEGSHGVLEIVPIENANGIVKVRWKLVRSGDAAPGKGEKAPPQAPKPKQPPVELPRGLEFLRPIPEFHGFRLGQDGLTIRMIAKEQSLAVKYSADRASLIVTRADGETLVLSMRDGVCSGIQRLGGGRLVAPKKEGEAVRDPKGDEELVARLVKSLDDPDDAVRGRAIHELRLLARRADITGARRTRRGSEFEAKVKGLVPVLIRAAADKADTNRVAALYALADTLDPEAVAAIRARVKDDNEAVRFNAACLLTEFQDASGLPELKKALKRLREQPGRTDSFDTERLLASFERITGKSFGEIPMNPLITSDSRAAAAATQRYRELLDTWAAWWDWMPPRN
jgi:RNA polymerase sigma factor (sigma-70 family)